MTNRTAREALAQMVWESSNLFSNPNRERATEWGDVEVSAARQSARFVADAILVAFPGIRETIEGETWEYAWAWASEDEPRPESFIEPSRSEAERRVAYLSQTIAPAVIIRRRPAGPWEVCDE